MVSAIFFLFENPLKSLQFYFGKTIEIHFFELELTKLKHPELPFIPPHPTLRLFQ